MAAVPVVNNLLAQRPFFMIKIHRQNLSTFIKILICLILRQNQERAILKMRTDSHGAACIMYRILCAIRWWRDRNSSISRHSALAIF